MRDDCGKVKMRMSAVLTGRHIQSDGDARGMIHTSGNYMHGPR